MAVSGFILFYFFLRIVVDIARIDIFLPRYRTDNNVFRSAAQNFGGSTERNQTAAYIDSLCLLLNLTSL